jgi:hypothetical protein
MTGRLADEAGTHGIGQTLRSFACLAASPTNQVVENAWRKDPRKWWLFRTRHILTSKKADDRAERVAPVSFVGGYCRGGG